MHPTRHDSDPSSTFPVEDEGQESQVVTPQNNDPGLLQEVGADPQRAGGD
jgi:hypothetical protein